MNTSRKYSVTETPDEQGEEFSPSLCACATCAAMHASQLEWETFVPQTRLQLRMKQIVEKIESRDSRKRKIPRERPPNLIFER